MFVIALSYWKYARLSRLSTLSERAVDCGNGPLLPSELHPQARACRHQGAVAVRLKASRDIAFQEERADDLAGDEVLPRGKQVQACRTGDAALTHRTYDTGDTRSLGDGTNLQGA